MTGERRRRIECLKEDARHIRDVLRDDSSAATELDSLEIEWSAALSEDLPELDAAYRASRMEASERKEYEHLLSLLQEMTPLLRRRSFAEPAEVLG